MSQFGSFIPEDQFQPTQDIPFEGGYALSPDTSAMMQAGSQNMDQPVFPGLRVGMPALNQQDIRALSETPVPPATVDFPGMPSQQELDAIRARRGGFEPLPQVPQEEIRSWEANKAGMPGQTAFDALWSQVTGEEAEDQRAFAAAYQPTLEQQFPRMSQTDLLGAIEAQRETQGVIDSSWLGIPATFIKPNFDRVIQNRNLQRDLRSGKLDSKFVTDYIRDLKVGDGPAFSSQVAGALERGGLSIAGTLNTVIKDIPAAAINYVTGGEWASGTISNAMAWAEYAQSLQEERLRPNSWLGQLTLDVIETAPQVGFQLATAGAGRLASTVAGLGRVGAGRVALGAFAVSGGGTAASGQFNESLATYRNAGMNDQEAIERAFYDASIAFANTTATSALEGAILGVGSIGSKTNRAIQRAAAATRMQTFRQGVVRGSMAEATQEFLDQIGTDFLVNLRREGMPEFEEFYRQNPEWTSDVLRNALYAGLVGGIIGAPAGVVQSFRQAAEARQISEEIRTVMGSLPADHPVQRLFDKDVLTAQEAVQALDWIGKQREKIGKITAKDIQSQRQVGAGLDYAAISDDALSNIIIAGNDGSVTAPLRGAPEGGRFAGIGFTITPAMAADELARRGLVSGQAPGAATAIGIRAMPTDADPKAVNPDDIAGWVDNNESVARAMAVQPEPISRRQMEEVYGGPFQGNNASLRARFKENLNRVVNERPDWREPGRLSASVARTRQAAAQDAVEMLTGLDGIELQRVALGLSPRQAKAVSETLAEAERETRRPTVMTLEEIARQGQDARALSMQRQREEAGMAAAAGARGEIGRGEVVRRAGEREAARRATEREQRMQEIVRSTTGMEAMREAQAAAVEALDRVEGVMRGTEEQQVVPMTDAMDAISVVEELARQAGIDAEQAMAPIRARATALAAVEEYARTQDLTPGMREAIGTTRRDRTAGRVADIIVEARRRAIDQYERDERTMAEDPNYIVSRLDAVRLISQEPEIADDIQTVIRSKSAFGLELAEARRKLDSQFILSLGQEPPAEGVISGIDEEGEVPDAAAVRSAEMRLRDRIDRIRRTGTGERAPAPTPTMEETRAAVDAALVSEQEQAEKRMAELRMEQAELRRERRELADAAHTGKRGQRTKKRKPMTEREKEVAQRLEEIDGELEELSDQVNDIANRRGMTAEAALEPKDVKETDSFPGVTASKRLEQIMDGRRQIAEANGIGTDELQIRYDDGQMRLTPAEKRLSNFGRKLGVTVVFAKGPRGLSTRGAYVSGVVFIRQSDVSSPQAYFSVALHEAVHHLAKTDREYFTNLYNMLRRKAPKALREMSAVYRKKLEFQKNQAAPRNAALQIMGDTGPDADARRNALIWLIRNDKGADYATIRENPGQTLAEVIDSYGPRAARPQQQALNEVRGLFAELVKRARQVNLSVRDVQEEEVANLAEMLFDTTFFAAVNDEGKIDITRIREIADTPRALSLFGRIAEMIDDVADALGVVKKDRALNPAQVARLREFMRTPEELAEPKVRIALQQLIAKSLTHMMDVRRGRVETEVAPPNPMSDARASEEIPGLMQSIDPQVISWTNNSGQTITQDNWDGSPTTFTSLDGRDDDVAIGFLSPQEAFDLSKRIDAHFGIKRTDAFMDYVQFMVNAATQNAGYVRGKMWMRPQSSPYRRAWASGRDAIALFHPAHFDMEVFAHELKHVLTSRVLNYWISSSGVERGRSGEGYMKGVSQMALSSTQSVQGQTLSDLARLFLYVNGLSTDLKGFASSNIEFSRYGEYASNAFDFSKWQNVEIHGKRVSSSIAYGLQNLDEFVAQAASDLEFQNFLRGIELPNTGPFRTFASAWDKIVDIIARLIPGFDQKYPSNNALQRVLALTNEMIDVIPYAQIPIRIEAGMAPWAVDLVQKAGERRQQSQARTALAQDEAERLLQRATIPDRVFFPQSLEMPTTAEAQRFYAESQIKDEAGALMPMFHGTPRSGFDEFNIDNVGAYSMGAYFTNRPSFTASFYAKVGDLPSNAGIYPVFLNITNPLYWNDSIDIDAWKKNKLVVEYGLQDQLFDGMPAGAAYRVLRNALGVDENQITFGTGQPEYQQAETRIRDSLIDMGFDGVVVKFGRDGGETWTVAWKKNQIKSVFNPRPTELPGISQSIEAPETPEWRAWFGDSKVVDKQGDPLVVYHQTSRGYDATGRLISMAVSGQQFREFDKFLPFTHFGTEIAAKDRFRAANDPMSPNLGSRTYAVYLSIKNPLRVTDAGASDEASMLGEIINGQREGKFIDIDVDVARNVGAYTAIRRAGYDGLVYENLGEDRGNDSWVIFDSNQAKSAFNLRPTSAPGMMQSVDMPSATEMNAERGDMVSRIDGSYRNSNANIEPGDIDDAERTIDQSISDEDSRFGRLSRAVNDTARRLTGREVPTREDRDAIEVVKRPADISPFWKFVAAPLNIAIASKNAEVISVVEDIIDFDIKRNMLTERRNREARVRWESIPQAERNEAEFAKYMDEFHDPATIDSDPEFAGKSQAWRDALKWFKERDEARRKDIIAVKREGIRRALQRDKASRIVEKAAQNGLEWEVVRGGRNRVRISTTEGNVTVDQARDMLAMKMMPDTWGRQYAHFFHWFAGEWKLTAYDADGNRTIIGSAKTEAEAFERLYRHRRDNPGQYRRYQAEPNVFVNPDDVVRLSTGQRRRLESLLSQATGASRTDVDDSLRGIVGSKGAKRPFYAPLMERTGAQGFETEFMKVWELSERLHNRWVMGGEMVRTITPRIEKIRQTMPGWAKYLDETMDHTLFTKPTAVEQAVDRFVRSVPVVGRLTSPFFTRRWLGAARALNYGRQLLTVRQQVVNSFQPIQTLYPVLGEANFAKAVSFYNSPEAKEVLERHGRMAADGKFREGSEETIPGVDIGGFLTRMNESVYKQTNGGVNLSSEARNQNFAFIAMYWHATNNLGMGDAEAARYARIYGNVYTQFYYTKANLPWIVRGPVAATALQYRRFMINMTGLMVNEFQKGNYSGVGRYLGTQFILGGSQAVLGFSAFGLIRSLYLGDKEGADDLSFKMRAWLKDSLGSDKAADIAMMGLPAAVGIDLSGSISVWQKPFGRTLYEKAGATFAGPTVNTLLQAYTNLTGDTVVPMNPLERGYRAFAETSPTIQQMVAAWKAFNGDNAEYDARGRLKYTLDPEDAWIKAGAFRTVDESIWRMEYERLRIIRNEVDRYSDRAATQLAVGNTAEARRILGEFNGMYPMAAMTLKDIKRRAEGKRQARTIPQAERRVEVDVGTRVREIAQAEGIGE